MSLDISVLVMDCDGVLTDGGLIYHDDGSESRRFNVKDGAWIRIWSRLHLKTAIITGKVSDAVKKRAEDLEIDYLYQRAYYKGQVFRQLLADSGIPAEQMAFIGDDIIDLPVIQQVGFSVAVADAVEEIRDAADLVTQAAGGQGAVQEVIRYLLKEMGLYEQAMERYLVQPDQV